MGDPGVTEHDNGDGQMSGAEDVTDWGRTEQDSVRYHHRAFPNGAQFKTHELFVSGNFHLVFSDLS